MQEGILHGSGRFISLADESGTEKTIELPETIHTFAAWKQAGYAVKKGEHAIASFPVWKYSERSRNGENQPEESESDDQPTSRMFMKKAFFFRACQVEKITA